MGDFQGAGPRGGFQRPGTPQNFVVRPLMGGIVRDKPSTEVPLGGMRDIQNYTVTPEGLLRRFGLRPAFGGQAVQYGPIQGVVRYWKRDGTSSFLVMDNKFLYEDVFGTLTPIYQVYDTGTITVSGTTVTGDGTAFVGSEALYPTVRIGDVLAIGGETAIVNEVISDTEFTIVSALSGTYDTATEYEVRFAWDVLRIGFLSWAIFEGNVVFADGSRPLRIFDGEELRDLGVKPLFVPYSVYFFRDRLWCGGYKTEVSLFPGELTEFRQNITWSRSLDKSEFFLLSASDPGATPPIYTQNDLGLYQSRGDALGFSGMGTLLIAWFRDSIYVGRPTELGEALPFQFDQFNTRGIGLVGPRAFTTFSDGHIFVGQDNVYALGMNGEFERIGDAITRDSVQASESTETIQLTNDTGGERILMGMPGSIFDKVGLLFQGSGFVDVGADEVQSVSLFADASEEWSVEMLLGGLGRGVILATEGSTFAEGQFVLALTQRGNFRIIARGTDNIVYVPIEQGDRTRVSLTWDGSDLRFFTDGIEGRELETLWTNGGFDLVDSDSDDIVSDEFYVGVA